MSSSGLCPVVLNYSIALETELGHTRRLSTREPCNWEHLSYTCWHQQSWYNDVLYCSHTWQVDHRR